MCIVRFLKMFLGPQYKRYIIFGYSHGVPLWNYERWLSVAELLNGILEPVGEPISVHSGQLIGSTSRTVRFGRLGWTPLDFQKWCHGSPRNAEESTSWYFVDTEVFCPARAECINSSKLPIVYVHLKAEPEIEESQNVYDQELHIVVRDWFWSRQMATIERCIQELAKLSGGCFIASSETTIWSLNQFESLPYEYRGMYLDPIPSVSKMKGNWREIPIEK